MLRFENVDVSIAKIPILRAINFTLNAGETIALIGRNGAGKTTTLRTVMGFTQATGGIAFEGKDLMEVAPHKRPLLGIGYAPEDRRLFSAFTVAENVALPGRVAKLGEAEIARRLDRAYSILPELKELGPRPAGSVSGGQGKMVALGRALMLGTKLVLLDEPFQGLAPVLANRYAEALRRLRDTDPTITLVITESNPELLTQFADRTLVIERGEMQPEGAVLAHA
ncbi:high-affinity branched-chain amino acid transport ATP-binding protein LivF [Variibacter gotjawalensis]|uniref:High-affinity branched-chain amino acid transport ATP-binding protein LivF n=1 Tax=Variibacter gotjawalensis TaxID=1333996 RepID=A0A0S3PZ99_9BRAD|nr:ATP-binding cassette domain-containing protein [Variibacter gotjawalensis]NIK47083.1 branched-chain amino acid transport system ATP-binding protein [Variibacter gotjawalensis]RZS48985.1 amino acid/amide ABC transporter ATP-binding protein 2 (HAAT family) [Variibacter gotjawalensis]BAT61245.1 high-affinity branched-chain amino acid transport ATP-binding protein LivF [Variibacter gotjawalensis]